ncbi:MAG TPA: nitroreductase family protein [Mycobacteriales bacterium]|nr:nitroreductase family protein [Mycobacteriales bacterium]
MADPAGRAAVTATPLHPLLAHRWSPRGFDPAHVLTRADLLPLLEAARWAPSAGNTQPTRWLVTLRGEPAHARLLGCLSKGNQPWAPRASALLVAVSTTADDTGRPYPSHLHDTGQATAHLTVQAHAQGLHVHQMGGFDADAVRREFGLSDRQQPSVVVALGEPGGEALPERLAQREAAARSRLPLAELLLPVPDAPADQEDEAGAAIR